VREHAKLLVDHTLFDYSIANSPWIFRGVWGRLFGQFGRWPIGAVETMWAMSRYGSTGQKMQAAGTYAAVSAAVYGMGVHFGVRTSDWIPFIHSLSYTGGPTASLANTTHDVFSGDPFAQDKLASDWRKDPLATIATIPLRMMLPGGDVLRALYSEFNMSRRVRRLTGAHSRPARTAEEMTMRLTGFRDITSKNTHHGLLKGLGDAAFAPIGHAMKRAIRPDLFPTLGAREMGDPSQ
jgi:hypothetical protein